MDPASPTLSLAAVQAQLNQLFHIVQNAQGKGKGPGKGKGKTSRIAQSPTHPSPLNNPSVPSPPPPPPPLHRRGLSDVPVWTCGFCGFMMHDPNKVTCRNRYCAQPRPGYTQAAAAQQYAKHLSAPHLYGLPTAPAPPAPPQRQDWNKNTDTDITNKYKEARSTQLASMLAAPTPEGTDSNDEDWEEDEDPFELFEAKEQTEREGDPSCYDDWEVQPQERKRIRRLHQTLRDAKQTGDLPLTTAIKTSIARSGKGKTSDPSSTHRDHMAKLSNGAVRLERIYKRDRERQENRITALGTDLVNRRTTLEQNLTALQSKFDEDVANEENAYTQYKLENKMAVETAQEQITSLESTFNEKIQLHQTAQQNVAAKLNTQPAASKCQTFNLEAQDNAPRTTCPIESDPCGGAARQHAINMAQHTGLPLEQIQYILGTDHQLKAQARQDHRAQQSATQVRQEAAQEQDDRQLSGNTDTAPAAQQQPLTATVQEQQLRPQSRLNKGTTGLEPPAKKLPRYVSDREITAHNLHILRSIPKTPPTEARDVLMTAAPATPIFTHPPTSVCRLPSSPDSRTTTNFSPTSPRTVHGDADLEHVEHTTPLTETAQTADYNEPSKTTNRFTGIERLRSAPRKNTAPYISPLSDGDAPTERKNKADGMYEDSEAWDEEPPDWDNMDSEDEEKLRQLDYPEHMRDRKFYDDSEDLIRKWNQRERYDTEQERVKKAMDTTRQGKGVQHKKVKSKASSKDEDKDKLNLDKLKDNK